MRHKELEKQKEPLLKSTRKKSEQQKHQQQREQTKQAITKQIHKNTGKFLTQFNKSV